MSPETSHLLEFQKDSLEIATLSQRPKLKTQVAKLYFESWAKHNLCESYEEALSKIESFNSDLTYLIDSKEKEKVYASTNTFLDTSRDIFEFAKKYSSYKIAEESAKKTLPEFPTTQICFSINAPKRFRFVTGKYSKGASSAKILIEKVKSSGLRVIAYSRFNEVGGVYNLLGNYIANLNHPENLGSVGMHEHLGGIVAAFIEGAREEDLKGGRGNVLVVYPKNKDEEEIFEILKKQRRLKPFEKFDSNIEIHEKITFLTDIWSPYWGTSF